MEKLQLFEKRISPRKKLTGLLPGTLSDSNKVVVNAKPIDISKNGLGILTNHLLEVGSQVVLKTHEHQIKLNVAWRKKDFGKNGLYRYGLDCQDTYDLEEVFASTGCLK